MVGPISTQQVFCSACNWNGCRKWRLTKERLTQSRSLSHDHEVKLMFWAASLRVMVAEVNHRRKKKDVAEVRGRKKRWLFQAWWTPTGGFGDAWWNWWRKSEWEAVGSWRGSSERERRESCRRLTGKRRKMETREWLVFLQFLDQIFFMLRPWNPPLFIGGGWGWFCLHRGKIWALNSVGKDPNR